MPFSEGVGIGAEFIIHFLPDQASIFLEETPNDDGFANLPSAASVEAARGGSGGTYAPTVWTLWGPTLSAL
jgi:hypothetical protein